MSVNQGDSGKLALGIYEFYKRDVPQNYGLSGPPALPEVHNKTFDDTIHFAVVVQEDDQINNLYLQVKPKIKFKDITYYIRLHYQVWQLGVLTIPYKYRFGGRVYTTTSAVRDTVPNDVSTSINVALSGGFRFGGSRFYYDQSKTHNTCAGMIALFAGPTVIGLTTSNTENTVANSSNQLGISVGVGGMLQLKNINFGAFGGMDIPVSSVAKNWIYANKIWLGFGIGLNLAFFTVGKDQSPGG